MSSLHIFMCFIMITTTLWKKIIFLFNRFKESQCHPTNREAGRDALAG